MTTEPDRVPARLGADALALAAELPLTADEASYVEAARAPNTLRGYRSDWSEFTTWCTRHRLEPLPAAAATISGYLTELARAGAKVGTMSRRLSAIRFAHQLRDGERHILGEATRRALRYPELEAQGSRSPGQVQGGASPLVTGLQSQAHESVNAYPGACGATP